MDNLQKDQHKNKQTDDQETSLLTGVSEEMYDHMIKSLPTAFYTTDAPSTLENRVKHGAYMISQQDIDLRRSEERYHKMVEEVEDYAILLLDKDGFIQNWNKGAEKIKGYKEQEIVGKHFRLFYRAEDQDNNIPQQLLGKAVAEGKAMHEGWRVRKDRSMFWGSVVITALHDDNNNVIGFSKVTRDLTERKMAEDQMKGYANDLEFQNQELRQFAFAAAHDMKEPLRKIQLYTNLILGNVGDLLPAKEKSYLTRTEEAVLRMQRLIDDMLVYSRTSVVNGTLEPVDLNCLAEEVQNSFQDALSSAAPVIRFEKLPVIAGIPFQLRQLFDNLVGNAIKYRHPERIPEIRISCEKAMNPLLRNYQANIPKTMYKITIKDNGIGFEQQYAEKIFEMFNRLHSRHNYPGTGIGLALCKRIMQNHKGIITAAGIPDGGATFCLYFPILSANSFDIGQTEHLPGN
jgi:PAS domain S-box-containing protein